MKYNATLCEIGKTYTIKQVDRAVRKNVVRKLDELGINCNLEDVKIKYNGMQRVSGLPIAEVWTFDCECVMPTTFWVMV